MSGKPVADCGRGGPGAPSASTTGAGRIGDSEARGVAAVSGVGKAEVCAEGREGTSDFSSEGKSKAANPRKPTLRIPAKMRRRFTRSSEESSSNFPSPRTKKNSTAKMRECKSRPRPFVRQERYRLTLPKALYSWLQAKLEVLFQEPGSLSRQPVSQVLIRMDLFEIATSRKQAI